MDVGPHPFNAERLRITVIDQGPGLTIEDCKDLFKPYHRLSARPTGGESSTGLGLSIAHDMTLAMGGTIDCRSEPGKGASFWITLPLA
ncbi:MAG: HAMP domain-containing sensor histidine kinase [Nibricoccus sp.]